MTSLRTQLWAWLLALLTGIGMLVAASTYWIVGAETNNLFDLQLRQIALNVGEGSPGATMPAYEAPPHDPVDDFAIQVWSANGTLIKPSKATQLPLGGATGFSNTLADGTAWRTFTLVGPSRTVQVSQQREVRDELVNEAVWRSLAPVGVAIPLSWLLLSLVINSVLGRLDVLTRDLAARRPNDRTPIPLRGLPREVAPLVAAVNDVLGRLQSALMVQKQFVSDAAHELRTPLAALQLQIGNLRRLGGTPESAKRIDDLDRGVRRATELSRQLLRQARYNEDQSEPRSIPVDLSSIATRVIAELLPLADDRHQDVGLVRSDPIVVQGDSDDIRIMIGNLVENACRYSPDGATIDVSIRSEDDGAVLEIQDTGLGIAADQLDLVFRPFHRAAPAESAGSGLGLSITQRIAERHGARVTLANRSDRSGLIARVTWPRHTMAAAS